VVHDLLQISLTKAARLSLIYRFTHYSALRVTRDTEPVRAVLYWQNFNARIPNQPLFGSWMREYSRRRRHTQAYR